MKSKRFIDARKLEREKDIKEFRAKLLYVMPKVPLKEYERNDNMELRCNAWPGLFNKINTYGKLNRQDKGQVFQNRVYKKDIDESDSEVSFHDSLDEDSEDYDADVNVDPDVNVYPRLDSDPDVDHDVNVDPRPDSDSDVGPDVNVDPDLNIDPYFNVDPRLDSDSDDHQVVHRQVNVTVHRVNDDCSSDDDDVDNNHQLDVVVHRAEHDDDD